MPEYLTKVAEIGGDVDAIKHHNPLATVTSRGCIRTCSFCAVPRIEGNLRELATWERKPIVCDNNLLACSRRHFNKVIDSLKGLAGVDFNQGLDARLLQPHHIDRLKELNCMVRLSWDETPLEKPVIGAIERLRRAGIAKRRLGVYVLIGYKDVPADALYRLQTIKALGLKPFPMRYQPLNTLTKNEYVAPGWTQGELFRFLQYWGRQRAYYGVPFAEFDRRSHCRAKR